MMRCLYSQLLCLLVGLFPDLESSKTTKMEDDQNGRQPKWKTTKMEDDQNGVLQLCSHVFVTSTEALTTSCFLYLCLGQPFQCLVSLEIVLVIIVISYLFQIILRLSKPINDALKELVETILL